LKFFWTRRFSLPSWEKPSPRFWCIFFPGQRIAQRWGLFPFGLVGKVSIGVADFFFPQGSGVSSVIGDSGFFLPPFFSFFCFPAPGRKFLCGGSSFLGLGTFGFLLGGDFSRKGSPQFFGRLFESPFLGGAPFGRPL